MRGGQMAVELITEELKGIISGRKKNYMKKENEGINKG